jgi:hypothetical protein
MGVYVESKYIAMQWDYLCFETIVFAMAILPAGWIGDAGIEI